MANKFLLVPEDIYRGLLTQPVTETGNINLDYTRKNLDTIKRQRVNNELKNINYNQELRRYLHMLKEQNQTPTGVAVRQLDNSALDQIKQLIPQITSNQNEKPLINEKELEEEIKEDAMYTADEGSDAETPRTSRTLKSKLNQRIYKIYHLLKNNIDKFNINKDGKILNEGGTREILGSNVQNSLDCIIRSDFTGKNKWNQLSPPGTSILEKRLKNDPTMWELIEKARVQITPKRINITKQKLSQIKKPKQSLSEEWRLPAEWK